MCELFVHVDCFFFQADDGIRDRLVTGVQTCALPICDERALRRAVIAGRAHALADDRVGDHVGTGGVHQEIGRASCRERV